MSVHIPINQGHILKQCLKYIHFQEMRYKYDPKYRASRVEYEKTDIETLKKMRDGQCLSFSALWLYEKSEGNGTRMRSLLERVSSWDGEIKSLREGEEPEGRYRDGVLAVYFEELINDLRWAYRVGSVMGSPFRLSSNIDKLYEMVKQSGTAPIVNEFNMAFVFKRDELEETLEKTILEDKFVMISCENHSIAVMKKNGEYYVYDPNSPTGEISFKNVTDMERHLEKILFLDKGEDIKNMPIFISSYRKEEMLSSSILENEKEIVELIEQVIPVNQRVTISHKDQKFDVLLWNGQYHIFSSTPNREWVVVKKFSNSRDLGLYLNKKFSNYLDIPISKRTAIYISPSRFSIKDANIRKYPSAEKLKKSFIERNNDINRKSSMLYDCLYVASDIGDPTGIDMLIKAGINLEGRNRDGMTPLAKASENGYTEIAKKLISAGANVEVLDKLKYTPLIWAAQNGWPQIVRVLIEAGANIEAKEKNGYTPLIFAAQSGNTEVAKELIKAKANIEAKSTNGYTPLILAAQFGHTEVAKELIKAKANIEACNEDDGYTPLLWAIQQGHIEIVKELIKAGANIKVLDESPLEVAAKLGHMEIVKELIKAGAKWEILESLYGFDKYYKKPVLWAPLEWAIQKNNMEVLKARIKEGADLKARYKYGFTPLMLAIYHGHTEIAIELVKAGAHLEARDKNGFTPLMLAACYGHTEIAIELFKNGAHLEAETDKGFTPLMLAANYGHTKIAKELVRAGARLEVSSKSGYTPLMFAVERGHLEMVKELLQLGANINHCTNSGETIFTLAKKASTEIQDLLAKAKCLEDKTEMPTADSGALSTTTLKRK